MKVAILLIICGIVVKHFKFYWIMAGYSTMSKQERSSYDLEKVATIFRNGMFGIAIVIMIGYYLARRYEDIRIQTISSIRAFVIGIPYLLYKLNSDKVKIKK